MQDGIVGLDYETKCDLDIRVVGLDQYINHPSFRVLLASLAYDGTRTVRLDFVKDPEGARRKLGRFLADAPVIVPFNAGFERAVTAHLKINVGDPNKWRDAAVVARYHGAGNKLEHAAPQLLGSEWTKLDSGSRLIRKFCGPGSLTWDDVKDDPDWDEFGHYCDRDAYLALLFYREYGQDVTAQEWKNEIVTSEMNQAGWRVDLDTVHEMSLRYEENKEIAVETFHDMHDVFRTLNTNSPIQVMKWCKNRGVNVTSTDEQHVEKYIRQLNKRLESTTIDDDKRGKYLSVLDLMEMKQVVGGSSLKKLKTIENMTGSDGRLRHQYMHIGAVQTFRTSGRGVQMQNLARLDQDKRDMEDLTDEDSEWTNKDLSGNLRQVFTATDPDGVLIVGDYSSVEARGLAYLAGQEDLLETFRKGLDPYKSQASKMFAVPYDKVDTEQRRTGKVSVLSCGYQAGPDAVVGFAAKMGIDMTPAEAGKLVGDWRKTNPMIVELWEKLDQMLQDFMYAPGTSTNSVLLAHGMRLRLRPLVTPPSLVGQHPGAASAALELFDKNGFMIVRRVFHGLYRRGTTICYHKPGMKKDKVWADGWTNPKTKKWEYFGLYGGKITGILTQSLCRELFFWMLRDVRDYFKGVDGITVVGQFHDEIVVDYNPHLCPFGLEKTIKEINKYMRMTYSLYDFPLEADVKYDYRYIK